MVAQLSLLSDVQLADIGYTRAQAEAYDIHAHGFYASREPPQVYQNEILTKHGCTTEEWQNAVNLAKPEYFAEKATGNTPSQSEFEEIAHEHLKEIQRLDVPIDTAMKGGEVVSVLDTTPVKVEEMIKKANVPAVVKVGVIGTPFIPTPQPLEVGGMGAIKPTGISTKIKNGGIATILIVFAGIAMLWYFLFTGQRG